MLQSRTLQGILTTLVIAAALTIATPFAWYAVPSQANGEPASSEMMQSEPAKTVHPMTVEASTQRQMMNAEATGNDFGVTSNSMPSLACDHYWGTETCIADPTPHFAYNTYFDWSYPCNPYDGKAHKKCEFSCSRNPVSSVSVTLIYDDGGQDVLTAPTCTPYRKARSGQQ